MRWNRTRTPRANSNLSRLRVEQLEDRLVPSNDPNLIVPAFSSLPGARANLYLDFNGHFDGTWGTYSNIDTPAYDIDGNPSVFSAAEQSNIYQIWQAVAEDYAPFNVNVTTVDPGNF